MRMQVDIQIEKERNLNALRDSRNMYRQLNKNMEYVLKNSIMCMLHTCTWDVA